MLLCKIEACLNSRPITPLRSEQSLEPNAGSFFSRPPDYLSSEGFGTKLNRIDCHDGNLYGQCKSRSGALGSKIICIHYKHSKWHAPQPEVQVNELVLVKNPLLPLSRWELARVQETHPGTDGHVRVVILRTARSVYKRLIAQICRLLVLFDSEASKSNLRIH